MATLREVYIFTRVNTYIKKDYICPYSRITIHSFCVQEGKDLPIKEWHSSLNLILFLKFFLIVIYSALLHLPPLRFHCAESDGCWDRTKRNFVSLQIIICLLVGLGHGTLQCAAFTHFFRLIYT